MDSNEDVIVSSQEEDMARKEQLIAFFHDRGQYIDNHLSQVYR